MSEDPAGTSSAQEQAVRSGVCVVMPGWLGVCGDALLFLLLCSEAEGSRRGRYEYAAAVILQVGQSPD